MIADFWKKEIQAPLDSRREGLFFLLLTVLFHLDKFLGPWGLIRIHDTFDSEFGRYKAVGELVRRFGLFGWFPGIAGGSPSYAAQFAPYYPLSILSTYVPLWLIYSALTLLLMWIAGYGMCRFLRGYVRMGAGVALVGGALFAIGSQIQNESIIHTVFNYAFPLFFMWTTGALLEGKKSSWRTVVGLLAMCFISYPVLTLPFYSALHLFLILFFNPDRHKTRKLLLQWALIWAGYSFLFVPQLYALLQYSGSTSRGYDPFTAGFLSSLGEYFVHFSNKSLALGALGGAVLISFRRPAARRAMLLGAMMLFLSAFFSSSAFNPFLGTLFAKMDLSHYSWTLEFIVILIVCIALPDISRDGRNRLLFLAGAGIFLGLGWAFAHPSDKILIWTNVASLAGVLAAAFLGLFKGVPEIELHPQRRKFLAAVAILGFASVFITARFYRLIEQEHHPFVYDFGRVEKLKELTRSSGLGRVASFRVTPTVTQLAGLETLDGRSPIFYGPYKRLIGAAVQGQFAAPEQKKAFADYWYDLYLLNGQARDDFGKDPHAGLSLNMPLLLSMNWTYAVSSQRVRELEAASDEINVLDEEPHGAVDMLPGAFRKAFEPVPLYVYHLKNVFPRGYLVGNAEICSSSAEMLKALVSRPEALRDTVFFSSDDKLSSGAAALRGSGGAKSAELVTYEPDRIVFNATTSSPSFLVVSNNFDPHWKANVDGSSIPIYRANGAFQAVRVEPGTHKITLEYKDPLLWMLHIAIFVGIVFLILAQRLAISFPV